MGYNCGGSCPECPPTETICDDSEDNDGDDYADCADDDCDGQSGGVGTCEYGTELSCADGFDNDADGDADCDDSDCPPCCGEPTPCSWWGIEALLPQPR